MRSFFSNLIKPSIKNPETPEEEFDKYCKELVDMDDNFHLMEWWRNNQVKYPMLSKLAIQIHSIPASSAAAERSFSLAGNLITEKRNRLQPRSVDGLLFLNSYYKNYGTKLE